MRSVKVCLLGDFAVGKTSLARRFVDESFSDRYLTTVGVKIDTKIVETPTHGPVKLVVWDIAGADNLDALSTSYVRGMAGYLLVADRSRASTLTSANKIQASVAANSPSVPFCFLVNKNDLHDQLEITDDALAEIQNRGWETLLTSAKTGDNVERAFQQLAERILSE
ncbi:MAG: Rab family GTPase [Xanthomonadales bacterium]|nr:Rab family GTPase [Xanthomonadales bacterium]